jgi:response regulator RpfG family c-di-GMP phosphodiesterase
VLLSGSGFEVIDRIRAVDPDVKIIVYGGSGDEAALLQATQRGASDLLMKPFDGQDLRTKAARVLNRPVPPVSSAKPDRAPLTVVDAWRRAQTVAADLLKWLGSAEGHQRLGEVRSANAHIEDVKGELLSMQQVLGKWPENKVIVASLEQASQQLPENIERARELLRSALDALYAIERQHAQGM